MGMYSRYRRIPRGILRIILAKYLVAIVNASFLLILNLYLRKQGYSDEMIGEVQAFQYAGILLLAFPQGLFVRGRRLKPFFIVGSIMVPVLALLLLQAFKAGYPGLGKGLLLLWSCSLLQIDAFSLPYIVRTGGKDTEPEAISLNYATFAAGMFTAGAIIALFTNLRVVEIGSLTVICDEYLVLTLVAVCALPGVLVVLGMREPEPDPARRFDFSNLGSWLNSYDWKRIFRAIAPTTIIAIGAGLTIPFINLFFNSVFGIDTDTYSFIGMGTAVLIFVASLSVPLLRRAFGYKIAITLSQSLAVIFLVLMACTELFAAYRGMAYFAVAFYMIRTPLMNMAGPMTSELVMNYVGERNQDLASALIASAWSGAWFISAIVFKWLRSIDLPYYQIFLLTAALYVVGVVLYYLLILDYRRLREGVREERIKSKEVRRGEG